MPLSDCAGSVRCDDCIATGAADPAPWFQAPRDGPCLARGRNPSKGQFLSRRSPAMLKHRLSCAALSVVIFLGSTGLAEAAFRGN